MDEVVFDVRNLTKTFPIYRGVLLRAHKSVTAVHNVSFTLGRGRTLGILGETGSGKSTLLRILILLHEPSAGKILFEGKDVLGLSKVGLKAYRRRVQIVLQNPFAALPPRMCVGDAIVDPLDIHGIGTRLERRQTMQSLLDRVGLSPDVTSKYPRELSGGECQRVAIARALALNPEVLLLDEAVSALDISMRAQLLNLFRDLQENMHLTYVFVSHDVAAISYLADTIAVMRRGEFVETADARELLSNPRHEYTQVLLNARPLFRSNREGC